MGKGQARAEMTYAAQKAQMSVDAKTQTFTLAVEILKAMFWARWL